MRSRTIHLINPKTDSLTTRPLYLNRALWSVSKREWREAVREGTGGARPDPR